MAVPTFSDQIRQAIKNSGISRYQLWKRTGVDQAALCRFMQGDVGLRMDNLDRLADELELTVEKKTENKAPSGRSGTRGVFFSVETKTLATACKRRSKKQRKTSRF